ncbi:uncharacterized protein LOC134225792 [Armigeres subalbatus]|uniref:uncharacterized protein LOC134225792 n=1 Tax=Armigeres subalbatus TaxID=124917 RepID=UPI002ED66ECD
MIFHVISVMKVPSTCTTETQGWPTIYLEATAWTMNQLDRNSSENKNNSTSHAAMPFPHGLECPLLCQVCTQAQGVQFFSHIVRVAYAKSGQTIRESDFYQVSEKIAKIREKIVVATNCIISTLSLSSLNSSSSLDDIKKETQELHELELRRKLGDPQQRTSRTNERSFD